MQTVDVAVTQVGVHEETGANDGVPATRYNHGDRMPWCAAFVLYCNSKSDDERIYQSTSDLYNMRRVQTMEDELKKRGWWLPPDAEPIRNDIIFFPTRGKSDAGGGRHVGIVEIVDGKIVHTIEGNLSNMVKRATYNLRDEAVRAQITGFGRIPGKSADPAK